MPYLTKEQIEELYKDQPPVKEPNKTKPNNDIKEKAKVEKQESDVNNNQKSKEVKEQKNKLYKWQLVILFLIGLATFISIIVGNSSKFTDDNVLLFLLGSMLDCVFGVGLNLLIVWIVFKIGNLIYTRFFRSIKLNNTDNLNKTKGVLVKKMRNTSIILYLIMAIWPLIIIYRVVTTNLSSGIDINNMFEKFPELGIFSWLTAFLVVSLIINNKKKLQEVRPWYGSIWGWFELFIIISIGFLLLENFRLIFFIS